MPTIEEIEAELEATPGITGEPEELDTNLNADDTDTGDDEDARLQAAEDERLRFETEAGRKGWVPREKFKGPADKWVDAKTFVERGERFNANLQREVQELRDQLTKFKGTQAAFVKFHEETIAKKDAEIAEAIKGLRIQRSQAMREGEDETVVEIEDRIELLQDQRKDLKTEAAEATKNREEEAGEQEGKIVNPVLDEWIEDGNKWFQDDPKMRSYAIAMGDSMIENGETLRGRKFLDLVAAKMREEFPRKFREFDSGEGKGGTQSRQAGSVEGAPNAGGARRGAGKTENDLPEEDRRLMKEFIASGLTTKEKFLKNYFSGTKTHN